MASVTYVEADGEKIQIGNKENSCAVIFYDVSANVLVLAAPACASIAYDIGTCRVFTVTSSGLGDFNTGVIFNESGANVDFRFESSAETHMLFIDGGESQVIVGGAVGPTTTARLVAVDDATGATARPFDVYVTACSQAANDVLEMGMWMQQVNNTAKETARWTVKLITATDCQVDSQLALDVYQNNALVDDILIMGQVTDGGPLEFIWNENSRDADFRVESNGEDHMLFVDGGNDQVLLGGAAGGNTTARVFPIDDAAGASGAPLAVYWKSASPADNDEIVQGWFADEANCNVAQEYGRLTLKMTDVACGSEDAVWAIDAMVGGVLANDILQVGTVVKDGQLQFIWNDDGDDADFRLESDDNANLFVVCGGLDNVSFGNAIIAGAFFAVTPGLRARDIVTKIGTGFHLAADTQCINAGGCDTIAVASLAFFGIPTWTGAANLATLTEAATVFIEGQPNVGDAEVAATNIYAQLIAAGDLGLTAGNIRLGPRNTFGTTQPTQTLVLESGTAPAGSITSSVALFTDGTTMKKIIANGTVSCVG